MLSKFSGKIGPVLFEIDVTIILCDGPSHLMILQKQSGIDLTLK